VRVYELDSGSQNSKLFDPWSARLHNFSHDDADDLVLYTPYDMLLLPKQAKLLQLWDFIDLPHEKSKQEPSSSLGFL
jgi:hypothetical protein